MKRTYLFITALIFSIGANAQITLTSGGSVPVVSDAFTYITAVSPTINVTQSGAGLTWDFSKMTGTSIPYSYINLASSVEPSSYPTANLVETVSIAENYYKISSSSKELKGQLIPGTVRAIYSDNRELVKFPITYLDVFNETFAGTVENIAAGQTFDRSGTNVITADGYGTLVLPYGTVNNVLKVTIVGNYSDMIGSVPVASYVDTIVSFYNSGTNNVLASYTSLYYNGSPFTVQGTYIDQSDLVTGLNDFMVDKNEAVIYPNPAKDRLTIKSDGTINKIEILDITGMLAKEITPSFTLTQVIDINDLRSGIYFVSYTNNAGTKSQKIIVE